VRTLEIEFLHEFKSIFETALVYESGDQLGTFGEITLNKKKSHATVPFKLQLFATSWRFYFRCVPGVGSFFLLEKGKCRKKPKRGSGIHFKDLRERRKPQLLQEKNSFLK
jgi:hypothetical protein